MPKLLQRFDGRRDGRPVLMLTVKPRRRGRTGTYPRGVGGDDRGIMGAADSLQSHKAEEDGVLVRKVWERWQLGVEARGDCVLGDQLGVENPHGVVSMGGMPACRMIPGTRRMSSLWGRRSCSISSCRSRGAPVDFTRTWCLGYAPERSRLCTMCARCLIS